MPTKVLDLEIEQLPESFAPLVGYQRVLLIFCLQKHPIGHTTINISDGVLTRSMVVEALSKLDLEPLQQVLLRRSLAQADTAQHFIAEEPLPSVTVAVCTRNRTSELADCIDALCKLHYPRLELLIVDNAPTDDSTRQLVQRYPHVHYVCEPRPGLDWARNRAILETQSEIIAFTDDDVLVDAGWVEALATIFAHDPTVMAVTGLVLPYELESAAQELFEANGGFGRGYKRRWHGSEAESKRHGAGEFGTGANMAFRRTLFDRIGGFDPALDVGTVTNGGGDLEIFFRILQQGHTLVYEPKAVVYHRHRRDYAALKRQLTNNGIGLYSYFVRSALAYPSQRRMFGYLALFWFLYWSVRRLILSFYRPLPTTRALILAEMWGSLLGLGRYQKARAEAARIERTLGSQQATLVKSPAADIVATQDKTIPVGETSAGEISARETSVEAIPISLIDLAKPLPSFANSQTHRQLRLYVELHSNLLGSVDIFNHKKPISRLRLLDAVSEVAAKQLPLSLDDIQKISVCTSDGFASTWAEQQIAKLAQSQQTDRRLAANHSVSIVVATYDRPDRLRNCLNQLQAQITSRPIEIVIVDNHPVSGVTAPVLAEFSGVTLVHEARQGLAYARNAGFLAAHHEFVVATDDDVIMPPDWLEKLLAPFSDPQVMAVTGNVLPLELETHAQQLFEIYGGLGRGFQPKRVGCEWFRSFRWKGVPTWLLGATANAAFRATIFHHPQIGLMDEALGPGMPSGVGEDTYLFYKILKAGYDIVYQPSAYVWHQHRRELPALRKQLYDYSKGHIAYHLTTWLRDGDWRGLAHIFLYMPPARALQIAGVALYQWIGVGRYPLALLLLEVRGNLAGAFALWKSRRRVEREGRSLQTPADTSKHRYQWAEESHVPHS